MVDIERVRSQFQRLEPFLDERGRRLYAANEAMALGRGGATAIAAATGIARSTINRGIGELKAARNEIGRGIRRPGAGRKREVERQPGLLAALEAVIEDAIRGDPEAPLRWVSRSQRNIAEALRRQGFKVSQRLIGQLLREQKYSCQANRKTREGTNHPDRNAQFAHINATVKAAIAAGEPAISVDTKKKELVGDFKNAGRELRPQGQPEPVRVHDFLIPELGRATPYGIYDLAQNTGWVSVGMDHDTAAFAVESIRRWWQSMGQPVYPKAHRLLITADAGGSNGPRLRLWKVELQKLADETGLRIAVCHFPPGTSKWNKIEHRLFSFISQNWRGKPLLSFEVIVNLIAATTTTKGLKVQAELDSGTSPAGTKIDDSELAGVRLRRDAFHGDWNYEIHPHPRLDG